MDIKIASQQAVMKILGYYEGAVDGLWGPKSIAAKRKWEGSGQFAPANPSHGMPFKDRDLLPSGVKRDPEGRVSVPGVKPEDVVKEVASAARAEERQRVDFRREFTKNQQEAEEKGEPAPDVSTTSTGESINAPPAPVPAVDTTDAAAPTNVVTNTVITDAAKPTGIKPVAEAKVPATAKESASPGKQYQGDPKEKDIPISR